jgi:hypothetical protein
MVREEYDWVSDISATGSIRRQHPHADESQDIPLNEKGLRRALCTQAQITWSARTLPIEGFFRTQESCG